MIDNIENAIRKLFDQNATNFWTLTNAQKPGDCEGRAQLSVGMSARFEPELRLPARIPNCGLGDVGLSLRSYY